ncbi:MAG: penicillin-binding protein [Prevotellaceae bacterium]|nr:penicillin-binding protein [Prevotellaceae bacterium]
MSKFEYQKSMLRYTVFAVLLTMLALGVLAKGFYIMTVERDYWNKVNAKMKFDSITVDAVRGCILSDNGQRLACNLPEYRMYMDFVALQESKADTLWHDSIGNDTRTLRVLCDSLHAIFPQQSAADFLAHLKEGYDRRSRYWPVVRQRVTYTVYNRVKSLPIFRLKPGVGGFVAKRFMVRKRPYGTMAASILGDTYSEGGDAYSGLEKAYDSILRGSAGYKHRRKVLNGWVDMLDSVALDGNDIVTTIDVGIQDLAERALIKELREVNGYTGVAIVMEVATGDIKAMVNVDRDSTGGFREGRNHAIADFLEPGSVFKTASFMVALEDGVIDTTDKVDTGCGLMKMYSATMRDHNWHRGGYGVISVPRVLQVSSNIGVSYLIDKNYKDKPEKFVEGLHRVGIAEDLDLPFPEYKKPRVRMPKKNSRGQWTNWSKTALPWMSIGYETNVPPISVLTFYNAIANNGVMVRPRFVTRVEKDGEVVKEYPVEVLKNGICSKQTLGKMQTMLRQVVSIGLGKTAGSSSFSVSGKTGTAQKASNGGYKNGTVNYLLSFCGYFPSESPRYSCIVCIHKAGLPASGGLMSGQVFHDIAEGIMAKNIKYDVKQATDSLTTFIPDVKAGNVLAADYVLSRLGFSSEGGWNGMQSDGKPVWGVVERKPRTSAIRRTTVIRGRKMPDVKGMGARDAVYLIESRGARVTIRGRGKVKIQSKPAGAQIRKGERVVLELA